MNWIISCLIGFCLTCFCDGINETETQTDNTNSYSQGITLLHSGSFTFTSVVGTESSPSLRDTFVMTRTQNGDTNAGERKTNIDYFVCCSNSIRPIRLREMYGESNERQLCSEIAEGYDGSHNPSDLSDIKTLIKTAFSNNTSVVELLGSNQDQNVNTDTNMRPLAVSAFGSPSSGWTSFWHGQGNNSVPLATGNIIDKVANMPATRQIQSTPVEQSDTINTNQLNMSKETNNGSIQGVYIPMDKLLRTRRQASARNPVISSLPNRRRVLFLTNSDRTRPAINRTLLLRPSLLLLRSNDSLQSGQIDQVRLPNRQRQVPQIRNRNLFNGVRRQPAIQRIDLREIDLSHDTPLNNMSLLGGSGAPNVTTIVINALSGNVTSLRRNNLLRNNPSRSNPLTNTRRNPANTSRRVRTGQAQNAIRRRMISSARGNNIRQGPEIEPRLTLQQPVRGRRIALLIRPNTTSRDNIGSRVRTISLPTRRRGASVRTSNRLATRNPSSTRSIPSVRRVTRRRRPTRTQRRSFRRVARPADPFTRRFSAGFQRGSDLLNQPDTTETRGFDGSVRREPNGFRGAFGAPPIGPGMAFPGGLGGFGTPGDMFRPPIL